MWLILAESDGLSDHADGLGSDAEALGFAALTFAPDYR